MAEEEQPFRLLIDEVYKMGGIGWIPCGTVQSGTLHMEKDCFLRVERTNTWFHAKIESLSFMQSHRPPTSLSPGDAVGFPLIMSKNDVVPGDVLTNRTTTDVSCNYGHVV
jgi:translation elongation factor EF-1alpha